MARFELNIILNNFEVTRLADQSTDCATIYSYKIKADEGDNLDFALVGDHENAFYILNGVTVAFADNANGVIFNNSLTLSFSVQNSGVPGVFDQSILTIDNNTISGYNQFIETLIRVNDSTKCGQVDASKYDDLTDTPNDKVGHAGDFIKVHANEIDHEYVSVLPADLNYTHVQVGASTTWNVAHNMGKRYPSDTILDGSGNRIFGDIAYTDTMNLVITFNTAFSGEAHFN